MEYWLGMKNVGFSCFGYNAPTLYLKSTKEVFNVQGA
jgi:hypothetical protein